MSQAMTVSIVPPEEGGFCLDRFRADITRRLCLVRGGRTIRTFANSIGVHHETLRRVLRGQPPSAEIVARVCDAERVSANWLLFGFGDMNADASAVEPPPPFSHAGHATPWGERIPAEVWSPPVNLSGLGLSGRS